MTLSYDELNLLFWLRSELRSTDRMATRPLRLWRAVHSYVTYNWEASKLLGWQGCPHKHVATDQKASGLLGCYVGSSNGVEKPVEMDWYTRKRGSTARSVASSIGAE